MKKVDGKVILVSRDRYANPARDLGHGSGIIDAFNKGELVAVDLVVRDGSDVIDSIGNCYCGRNDLIAELRAVARDYFGENAELPIVVIDSL